MAVCRALHDLTVEAPVAVGSVIVKNILNTGVDVVASRDLPMASRRPGP